MHRSLLRRLFTGLLQTQHLLQVLFGSMVLRRPSIDRMALQAFYVQKTSYQSSRCRNNGTLLLQTEELFKILLRTEDHSLILYREASSRHFNKHTTFLRSCHIFYRKKNFHKYFIDRRAYINLNIKAFPKSRQPKGLYISSIDR